MTDDDVIFNAKEDIEDWEPVEGSPNQQERDYNDYDIEFIDTEPLEEGDHWVGVYTGHRQLENAQSANHFVDNNEEEQTYAFPDHVQLKTKVADTELEEHQSRADNPVEVGEKVAIIYQGTQPVEGRPMDMHIWEIKRPPQ